MDNANTGFYATRIIGRHQYLPQAEFAPEGESTSAVTAFIQTSSVCVVLSGWLHFFLGTLHRKFQNFWDKHRDSDFRADWPL